MSVYGLKHFRTHTVHNTPTTFEKANSLENIAHRENDVELRRLTKGIGSRRDPFQNAIPPDLKFGAGVAEDRTEMISEG